MFYGELNWPTGLALEPASVPLAHRYCLDLEQDGRQLQAWALDAPLPWLERLAAVLEPLDTDETLGERTLPVGLIAGWSRVEQQTLTHLQPG
ncbi:hypothetical protein, partial [Mesorhizobium japonicum]|uniref:hypothetical protein n=1 Tax=Mesorhizobium japonicum TaxID=2066070 RepID=UPI003B5B3CA2